LRLRSSTLYLSETREKEKDHEHCNTGPPSLPSSGRVLCSHIGQEEGERADARKEVRLPDGIFTMGNWGREIPPNNTNPKT